MSLCPRHKYELIENCKSQLLSINRKDSNIGEENTAKNFQEKNLEDRAMKQKIVSITSWEKPDSMTCATGIMHTETDDKPKKSLHQKLKFINEEKTLLQPGKTIHFDPLTSLVNTEEKIHSKQV